MNEKIRVGLLIDSLELPAWIVEMIKKITVIDGVDLVVIITPAANRKNVDKPPALLWSYNFYARVDRLLYKSLPDPNIITDLSPVVKNIPTMQVATIAAEKKIEISPTDISVINNYQTDVLVKLGFEGLFGKILDLPRLGVWALDCYKEIPASLTPGIVQFFNGLGVTPSTARRLSNDSAKEKVLYRSFSMTDEKSLNRNLNKLYWKSVSFIPRLLLILTIKDEDWFWNHIDNSTAAEIDIVSVTISNGKILKTLLNKIWAECRNRIVSVIHPERWQLYYHIGESDKIETEAKAFKKIPCPKNAFWADPHAVNFNNRPFVFFEEWDYKKNKGHISVLEFSEGEKVLPVLKVLEKPYHLSYPFIFQWKNIWYMIPETAANKTIELYKCVNFPGEWAFVTNLMENIHAVDTTLHFHNNKWWLFANMVENVGASALDELFVFYADDFLTAEWAAHKLNPVVSDSRNSRPAGALFSVNNKMYRPSQCSDKNYGRSTNINEIIKLTEDDFLEIKVASLIPQESGDYSGIHSYSKLGGLTVIDRLWHKNN